MRPATLRPSESRNRIAFGSSETGCEVVFLTEPLTACAPATGSDFHASVPSNPEPQPPTANAAAAMQASRFIRARNVLLAPRRRAYARHVAIRVVLAEDSLLVREGVRRLLELQPGVEVVATCADLESLLAAVESERPDVVLTDIRMPPRRRDEGIQAALDLRATHPGLGVVVLSQYAEPAYALALLEGGAERRAYLLKDRVDDPAQLVGAIESVAAGGSFMDSRVVEGLVQAKTHAEQSPLAELTPRELDVLREMAQGKNNAAIAESLVVAERSVEKYVHAIFSKLGLSWEDNVHRRVKAVLLYLAAQET